MPINEAEFQVRGVRDPQLAVHATSGRPAWLWANDGTRILWANPAGAAVFGVSNSTALAKRSFGPADQHRRQVARLAGRLPLNGSVRLERLRGFGMSLGQLLTCACTRLVFTGGGIGVLVVALDPVGRPLPYPARLQGLVDDIDAAAVAFTADGLPAAANAAATALLATSPMAAAGAASLGLEQNIHDAVHTGRAETSTDVGDVVLSRVGQGADVAVIAIITPPVAEEPEADLTAETAAEPAMAQPAPFPAGHSDLAAPSTEPAPPHAEPEREQPPPNADSGSGAVAPAAPPAAADMATIEPDDTSPTAAADTGGLRDDEAIAPHAVEIEAAASASVAEAASHVAEPSEHLLATASEVQPAEAPVAEPFASSEQPAGHIAQATAAEVTAPAPQPPQADSASAPDLSPPLVARRHPLRFMWQMDAEGRFALGSDEFSRLIGPHTATAFGRPWPEIVAAFGLDPEGRVAAAVATRDTWSGIVIDWPADGHGTRLPVELSGLPIYDRTRQFLGYRGFGVCRDLDALARLAELRRQDLLLPPQPAPSPQPAAPQDTLEMDTPMPTGDTPPPSHDAPTAPSTETDKPVDTPQNVVPFRPATDLKTPTLTPVENNAFNELARQLAARLETERRELDARDEAHAAPPIAPEPPVQDEPAPPAAAAEPSPLAHALPHGDSRRDTLLYDRMPVGILIYRLDRLLYANRAFLAHVGYRDLPALTAAGGLDALYVEPGDAGGGSLSEEGAAVTIAAAGAHRAPTEARLHHIAWDGEDAHALIFAAPTSSELQAPPAVPAAPAPLAPATSVEEELGTILDATDDGILIVDHTGAIVTCNRGAEILFGYGDRDIVRCHLTDLFAPGDHDTVRNALEEARNAGRTGRVSQAANGRTHSGEIVPLRLTLGRSTATGDRFFAIARREAAPQVPVAATPDAPQPDRAAQARADILARISHEVRTPLNAIIGFTDVMVEERFGALGNERYAAYLKDIRAAGERVLTIINDMLDLSRAETGKLDLTFARQDLNDMVEKCVTIMQPQANRERIIIRTSLAHALPPVTADAGALRQIVLNLVGNSIHVARAGGQVIVSTALSDLGDVVLRIRDTGRGFGHPETETGDSARPAAEQIAQDNAGINLSLTRALVEANRGQFHIKATPQAGTLVEVAFPPKAARAV